MRILLLQDQIYLPSVGGGNKANRLLMEGLAERGHRCRAVASALTTRGGPTSRAELREAMTARGIPLETSTEGVFGFSYRGVGVEALDSGDATATRRHVARTLSTFDPDWILVADDKHRLLLDCAVHARADRVILILQTVFHLPFGPHAVHHDPTQAELMGRARGIVAISEYLGDYLKTHGGLDATLLRLPVFGAGPFPRLSNFARGFVTLINPCVEKGLTIFLELAEHFADVEFAAVPTWGADQSVLRALRTKPNVTVRPPVDDIDMLLADTRVLLVPSMWPETFGYVAPEAMLRGIPVIASNVGGLPEAKLGVDYVLPVRPAAWRDGGYHAPPQDIRPWVHALGTLLGDPDAYEQCAEASRRAALRYARAARTEHFETYLRERTTVAPPVAESGLAGKDRPHRPARRDAPTRDSWHDLGE